MLVKHLTHRTFRTLFGAALLGTWLSVPVPTLAAAANAQIGSSGAGNYLAGRHAEQVGEDADALALYTKATTNDALATAGLYRRIYFLGLTEGRIDEALNALAKVEKLDGRAPFANLVRAAQALKANDYARVSGLLKDEDKGLMRLLTPPLTAWAKMGQNDLNGALDALEALKDQAAFHELNAGFIQYHAGNTQAAEQHFQNVLKKSSSPRVAQLLGTLYERVGKVEKARQLYSKYALKGESGTMLAIAEARIKANKRPPLDVATPQQGAAEALFNIASVLQAQADDHRVLVLAHLALYLRPDLDTAKVVVATAMENDGRYAAANAIYDDIAKSSPLRWNTRLQKADNLDRMDKTDTAIQLLKSLAAERPLRTSPMVKLGDILRRHERFKEAVQAYTDVLQRAGEIKERHWPILYARGIAYEQTDQWPRAEQDFLKALEFQPDQPSILNYLGYSWIDQGLHLERALKMIEQAVDLRPRDGYIVDSLGWGLYRLGKFDLAVKKMERAAMLRPADPVINDHLGDALWQVGRTREARFQWERAQTLEPNEKLKKLLDIKLKDGLAAPTK
ncbi:MAG: tetratricopeptide repeat protein [Magnetovibrio sp.]|nr:tetratricopeptide repeat protein [Magnetovibrio sp.]